MDWLVAMARRPSSARGKARYRGTRRRGSSGHDTKKHRRSGMKVYHAEHPRNRAGAADGTVFGYGTVNLTARGKFQAKGQVPS